MGWGHGTQHLSLRTWFLTLSTPWNQQTCSMPHHCLGHSPVHPDLILLGWVLGIRIIFKLLGWLHYDTRVQNHRFCSYNPAREMDYKHVSKWMIAWCPRPGRWWLPCWELAPTRVHSETRPKVQKILLICVVTHFIFPWCGCVLSNRL